LGGGGVWEKVGKKNFLNLKRGIVCVEIADSGRQRTESKALCRKKKGPAHEEGE